MRRLLVLLLLACVALPAGAVRAQARAWLERDRIAAGETSTLHVEADGSGMPDYAPLLAEFDLSGHSSRQQFEWVAGRPRVRSVYTVALRPRRTGVLRIPPLRVGAATTAPLTLFVTPATAAPAQAGRDVFVESEVDDRDPYVQQSVGWVIRAHAAVPLLTYELTQAAPTGATMLQVGGDLQYRRTVGNRTYTVIERRYTLVPERAGTLALPSARFAGQGVGGMFDRLFGDGRADFSALSPPRHLQVRPIPADAPQPWLPLHGLKLRYLQAPDRGEAGRAATVVVEVEADGVAAAQMPAIELGEAPGVQVYAERPQSEESIVAGRPRVRITRRFSIVPAQAGTVVVPGPSIDWWDVRGMQRRSGTLPPIRFEAAPGTSTPAAGIGASEATGLPDAPGDTARRRPWTLPALVVALAALAAALLLRRRRAMRGAGDQGIAARRPTAGAAGPDRSGPDRPGPPREGPTLARLLEMGDLGEIEMWLREEAPSDVSDLDGLAAALDDEAQREAIDALRRARWAGGDPVDARQRLRAAFARGPRWRTTPVQAGSVLPPLYPED